MQIEQARTLFTLRAIRGFIDDNAAKLGTLVASGRTKKLDGVIARLSDHAAEQDAHTRDAQDHTNTHRALRSALLRDHMALIARTARIDLPDSPDMQPLRMPRGHINLERLAAASRGMAHAAAPHADLFIASGLPADFIDQMNAVTDQMVASRTVRRQSVVKAVGATEGLRTAERMAGRIVKQLDVFVRNEIRDDPALLAAWDSVRRVQRARTSSSATGSESPAPAGFIASSTAAPTAA